MTRFFATLGLLGMTVAPIAVHAEPVPTSFTAYTCEERNANLDAKIASKQAVHDALNARQAELQARVDALEVQARERGISTVVLDAAMARLAALDVTLENAYQAMSNSWKSYQGQACNMTEAEWVAALNYMNPIAQTFEAAGKTASQYRETVVMTAYNNLVNAVLSFGR